MNEFGFIILDIYNNIKFMGPAIILVLIVVITNAATGVIAKWIAGKEHEKNIKHKLDSIAEQEITDKEIKIARLKKENNILHEELLILNDIINSSLVLNNRISQILTRIHEKHRNKIKK